MFVNQKCLNVKDSDGESENALHAVRLLQKMLERYSLEIFFEPAKIILFFNFLAKRKNQKTKKNPNLEQRNKWRFSRNLSSD